jgi:hypothetical protein
MENEKTKPFLDLFKCQVNFNDDDKPWFKLTVMVLMVLFYLALAFLLKQYVLPLLAPKGMNIVGDKIASAIKAFRSG